MKRKTKSMLLMLPAEIILVCAFIASVYIKFSNKIALSWATPIILLMVIVLYFYGKNLGNKNSFEI